MKYLKRFNEELNTRTYRNAAHKLDYYNKSDEASKLLDFADEKDYGLFNMIWSNRSSVIAKNINFTQPELKGIYYCEASKVVAENNSLIYGKDPEMMAEELIENWKNGRSGLSITFEFSFRATRQALESIRKSGGGTANFQYRESKSASPAVPFFLELTLSEWYGGVEEWDEDARLEAEENGYEFTSSTIASMYDWTKMECLYIHEPIVAGIPQKCGVFSDRKSAIKFKNWLLSIVDDKIKDSIMNVLRIVGAKSESIVKAVDEFSKIKIQGLFDNETNFKNTTSHQNLHDRWFGRQGKQLNPN